MNAPATEPRPSWSGRARTRVLQSLPTVRLAGCIAAAFLGAVRLWPHAPLWTRVPLSATVWSADGELLRVTLASDDQYRVWTPLSGMSSGLVEAFLLKEDRWFYWHPGVNPAALARAGLKTFHGTSRQGGSTISMQLARKLYGLRTRTAAGKLWQIGAALWLEARYSKRELLEAYLNLVPFGGNTQGAAAASRIFFGKAPERINLGEAVTLAVIPQSPANRGGRGVQPEKLQKARAQLATLWLRSHSGDEAERRQLEAPVAAQPEFAMPWSAPHFVDALLANRPNATSRVDTTLDGGLQRMVERQIGRYIEEYAGRGIRNAAALLVDTREMSVKAWVGSAGYWNQAIDGQVDGVLAKRSPGSALKPILYAMALDQGILHPRTILRDEPTSFGPFTPENFDGRFFGPIPAEEALVRSRNIPAVWIATQLRQPSLYGLLQSAGVRRLKPESYYGLALALGGGEVTMEELAGLYGMLANQGVFEPLRATPRPDRGRHEGTRLLSPEAAFITLDMLRRNPPPDDDGAPLSRRRWPVAWKTGTSWGFRDAWSAGVLGNYVLVVWIGDFSGKGNPSFVGVDAAAPLFFRIADALNLARANEPVAESGPPPGLARVAVCAASGDLPNAWCPQTVETWYIPGKSPIRVSQLHRAVGFDIATGRPGCPPYAPEATRFEVFEFWSSDMLKLFREAGMPRRRPPAMPACAVEDSSETPHIISPRLGVSYTIRVSQPEGAIALEASAAADVRTMFWFDGTALVGKVTDSTPAETAGATAESSGAPVLPALPWRPSAEGVHLIRVIDDHGRAAEGDFEVQFAP